MRFDAAGQIEPGLAERWIVTDEGKSFIFRLREARWSDGEPVTADQVASRLQRQIRAGSRNPLAPFLTAIDEIVAMTPQVIEVRLKRPRPDLLKLFAQPELSILRPGRPIGSGPLAIAESRPDIVLRPLFDPNQIASGEPARNRPEAEVRLTGERAALAVARFRTGRTDLVAGGTFADLPLVAQAQLPPAAIRVDPAAGLFGLLIVSRDGFLADAANRAALAQVFDRGAITAAVTGWAGAEQLLPEQLDSAAPPHVPAWAGVPIDQRRAAARTRVAAWSSPVELRLALPDGPGATLLWGQVHATLASIGVTALRVLPTAPAELRLIDAVAPYDSARWYLAAACQPCGTEALAAVLTARDAPTMAERAQRIAEADAALVADTPYIPLARPLRWSLVAPRLTAWQPNARAWHPLNRLRSDPN